MNLTVVYLSQLIIYK